MRLSLWFILVCSISTALVVSTAQAAPSIAQLDSALSGDSEIESPTFVLSPTVSYDSTPTDSETPSASPSPVASASPSVSPTACASDGELAIKADDLSCTCDSDDAFVIEPVPVDSVHAISGHVDVGGGSEAPQGCRVTVTASGPGVDFQKTCEGVASCPFSFDIPSLTGPNGEQIQNEGNTYTVSASAEYCCLSKSSDSLTVYTAELEVSGPESIDEGSLSRSIEEYASYSRTLWPACLDRRPQRSLMPSYSVTGPFVNYLMSREMWWKTDDNIPHHPWFLINALWWGRPEAEQGELPDDQHNICWNHTRQSKYDVEFSVSVSVPQCELTIRKKKPIFAILPKSRNEMVSKKNPAITGSNFNASKGANGDCCYTISLTPWPVKNSCIVTVDDSTSYRPMVELEENRHAMQDCGGGLDWANGGGTANCPTAAKIGDGVRSVLRFMKAPTWETMTICGEFENGCVKALLRATDILTSVVSNQIEEVVFMAS